jgi:hypothetical protein
MLPQLEIQLRVFTLLLQPWRSLTGSGIPGCVGENIKRGDKGGRPFSQLDGLMPGVM